MTLACGNTNSIVAKLSTYSAVPQSLFPTFIESPIGCLNATDDGRRGAVMQPANPLPCQKDAA